MDYIKLGMGRGIVRRVPTHDTLHLFEFLARKAAEAEEAPSCSSEE
jgi:hypothetical protein